VIYHTKVRRLVTYALAGLGVAFGVAAYWAGDFLTKPARSNTGALPADLDGQSLMFSSASGGRLSAWFIPGTASQGAVLLLHPIRSNKRTMLSRAKFLKRQGYSILLVDFQAHGESEGDRITFGYREAKDVEAAVEKLHELAPGEKMAALGVSLGAAALVLSDAHGSLSAVVLESPYANDRGVLIEPPADLLRGGGRPANAVSTRSARAEIGFQSVSASSDRTGCDVAVSAADFTRNRRSPHHT
jgi:pimeloyl-ACP methyl ester carboxylesterase